MTLPNRLLATSNDALELAILRSIKEDRPSPAAYARTAKALGVGLGTVAWSGAAIAAGASAGGGVATQATTLVLAKSVSLWITIGLASAGATYGVVQWTSPPREEAPLATAPSEGARPPVRTGKAARPPTPESRSSSALETAGVPTPDSRGTAAHEQRTAPSESGSIAVPEAPNAARQKLVDQPTVVGRFDDRADSGANQRASTANLSEEVRMLDRVREALARHDGPRALVELDGYQRSGATLMTLEASLLRVEALLQTGRQDEARRLATDLLGRQPPARVARRLQDILRSGGKH